MGKQFFKRVLPTLLAFAMMFTSVPVNVLAADLGNSPVAEAPTGDNPEFDGGEVLGEDAKDVISIDIDYDEIVEYLPADVEDNKIVVTVGNATSVINALKSSYDNDYLTTTKNKGAIGASDTASLKSNLDFKIQKADGSDGSSVVDTTAGDYKLVISLKESATTYTLASDAVKEILFKVEPIKLYVTGAAVTVKSGDKVSDVKTELKTSLKIGLTKGANNATDKVVADGPAIVVAENGTALADDVELLKSKDYTVTVTYTLKDDATKAMYEVVQADPFKVTIDDLRDAVVNVELLKDPITRPYTGEAVAAPVINGEGAEVKVTVTTPDEIVEGKAKVITPATISGKWYTVGTYNATTNPNSLGEELTEAPSEVGSYKYEIICFEDDAVYKELTAHKVVDVVITAKGLVLEPVANGEFTVYKGQKVSEVVKNYKAKLTLNGADVSYDEKFFGVTYNDPSVAQYYQPIFKLQMGSRTKTAEGATPAEITNWSDVPTTAKITKVSGYNKEVNNNELEYEYRIVFSGKKGVYTNGELTNIVDVNTYTNTADKQYTIDLAESYKKTVAVDVKPSANATFVVDDIVAGLGGKGVSVNAIYRKVYDHEPLFADRAAYKKVAVKDASGNPVDLSKLTGKITYTWYKFTPTKKMEGGNPVYDENGKPVYEEIDNPFTEWYEYYPTEYTKLPKDAGVYFLQIHYNDTENDGQYVIKDAYLYFEIEKQIIKVVPEGTLTAYTGSTVDSLIEKAKKDITYKFYKVPGNDVTKEATDLIDLAAEQEKYREFEIKYDNYYNASLYTVNGYVEKDNDPDPAKENYVRMFGGTFAENESYRYGADLTLIYTYNYEFDDDLCDNLYYDNYTNLCTVKVNDAYTTKNCSATIPVTVKKSGDKVLDFVVDNKMPVLEKTYDGTGIDVASLVEKGFITAKEHETGTAVDVKTLGLTYKWTGDYGTTIEPTYVQSGVSPVHAGTYRLDISFDGNDTYMPNYYGLSTIYWEYFTIKPRDLTITLPLKDTVEAGYYDGGDVTEYYDLNKEGVITGYIAEDAEAFGNGVLSAAKAFFYEDDKDYIYNVQFADVVLEYDKEYKVCIYNSNWDEFGSDNPINNIKVLKDHKSANYKIVVKNDTIKANKHGKSEIYEAVLSTSATHHVTYLDVVNDGNYTNTITVMDGIPYCYNENKNDTLALKDVDGNKIPDGNYVAFAIHMPYELYNTSAYNYAQAKKQAAYINQINAAGGYVLDGQYLLDDDGDRYDWFDDSIIPVIFPITKDKNEFTFQITWPAKDSFVETFNVKVKDVKKQLEDNLMEAVAPKTLAFNAVNKKMVIGEKQNLDVKMTKLQSTDIVKLNYAVINGNAVSVDKNSGVATALKAGSATIEVYPVKLNDKGEYEKINMAKKVTVKINVKDVTVPKVSSVFTRDYTAKITYKVPADGYRREIYVMEGDKTEANFKTAIEDMEKTGKKFDGKMLYRNGETKDTKGLTEAYVYGLDPNKNYTVYVRNVSAVRTLDDGKEVAVSAKGSLKKFTTTKVQADPINMKVKDSEFEKGNAVFDKWKDNAITFNLDAKKIQLDTFGTFNIKKSNVAEAADDNDKKDYALPLTEDKDKLCAPKLTYYVLDTKGHSTDYDPNGVNLKTSYYTKKIGDLWYAPSKIASIDKNGKLTLKGVGTIYIYVYDSVRKAGYFVDYKDGDGNPIDSFDIKTDIGALKGKTVKNAKVGDTIDLYDYVEFKNKKDNKKVIAKPGLKEFSPITVTSEENSAVTVYEDQWGDVNVTINEPGKTVTLDVALKYNPEVKTKVTINTKAMAGVKSLKAVDVVDDQADFTFTYTTQPYEPLQNIRVEVRDARGSLMSSKVLNCCYDLDDALNPYRWDYYDTDLVSWFGIITKGTNAAKGKYVYRFKTRQNIVKQSNYKVTVYPIYNDQLGKAATAKFKTTNVPYSHENVGKTRPEDGKYIAVLSYGNTVKEIGYNMGYFTSGNVYNLKAYADNNFQYNAKTDKLTWSIKNTGIASVKVLPGTYEAVLTAKKPGRTTIEVKSGITKKVIARWYVRVKSVGNGDNAYGKNMPNNDATNRFAGIYAFDDTYNQGVEVLTEANPVRFLTDVNGSDYRWVAFEAQYDAVYKFYFDDDTTSIGTKYYDADNMESGDHNLTYVADNCKSATLSAGQKIYIKMTGTDDNTYATLKVEATGIKSKLTLNTGMSTEGISEITFSTPEAGFYRISSDAKDTSVDVDSVQITTYNDKNTNATDDGVVFLNKGTHTLDNFSDAYIIKVETIAHTELTATEAALPSLKNGEEAFYKFTAAVAGNAGDYKIKLKDVAEGSLDAVIYAKNKAGEDTDSFGTGDSTYTNTPALAVGDTVWVKLTASAAADKTVTGKISLTAPAAP